MKANNWELKVRRKGVEESLWVDMYHRLLTLSWIKFFLLSTFVILVLDFVFALGFYFLPGSVANINPGDFLSNFAFSVQTMATIGYGYFYPQTTQAHFLVTLESTIGMFATALLTGLIFAKFARPSARIVFSDNLLLTKQNKQDVLTMRLGNVRANQVYEGQAKLTLLRDEMTEEGEKIRRLVDLKLLRKETPIFALSWTLFHIIDESSPLKGVDMNTMASQNWEFIVTFIGVDQDMAQSIVAHRIFKASDVIQAKKFADMIQYDQDTRVIDFSKINLIEK